MYVETKNHRAVIDCTVFVNIDIIYNLIPDLRDICEADNDCRKRIKNAKCIGKDTKKSEIVLKLYFFQVSIPVAFPMLVVYQKIQYANRMISFIRNSTLLNQSTRVFKVRTLFKTCIKM